jgi:hypothetical protein
VLLFFLVTGSHPVEGNDFAEVGRAHRAGRRRRLRDARPDLPEPFIELIETALSSEPSERMQTASAFRRALQATLPTDRQFRPSSQSSPDYSPPPSSQFAAPRAGLQRLLLALAGAITLSGAMGFITTTAFNLVLRRTGEFAAEGVLAYFVWGIRSLVAPTVWVVTLLLAFNVVALVVRSLANYLPPVRNTFQLLTERTRRTLDALNMRNANALGQALSVTAGAALAATAWMFSDLLGALASNVNDSPSGELSVFGSGHYDTHVSYRLTLNLIVLVLATGIVTVLRYARRHGETMQPVTSVSMIGVLCLAFVMMALPWRVLFSDTFAMGAFGERRCFILGETSDSTLISCPSSPAPRNVVLRRGDPRLSDEHRLGSLFDAFEGAPASQ